MGPGRLTQVSGRQKLTHHRFEVQNRGAIDRIQTLQNNLPAVATDEAGNRHTEPVRAILASLRKNANLRPGGVATWMAGTTLNLIHWHAVKQKNHLDMREIFNAIQGIGAEFRAKFDSRLDVAPAIIARIIAWAANISNGFHSNHKKKMGYEFAP